MPRVKTGPYTKKRRKKWLNAAKGYWGGKSKQYRSARVAVMRAFISAYKERRRKKRDFRSLMITRINAALRPLGLNYSRFIHGLALANVALDRSVLSELAVHSPEEFAKVVDEAMTALGEQAKAKAEAEA